MANNPDFDSTYRQHELQHISNNFMGRQESILNGSDFDMVQYPSDEMPPLQKTDSALVHAQKIQRPLKQKLGPVTYKFDQRKKSSSGVDKKEKAREKLAQFTGGNIMENNILEPLIIKNSTKDRNNLNA